MKDLFEFVLTAAIGLLLFFTALEVAVWSIDQGAWTRLLGTLGFISLVSYMMGVAVVASFKARRARG